ncbi:MAG: hypothetical protein C0618_02610 [Desulfuromonas sp.]|nr:MAG: hypothetical protein C0618_02610 [Desulfuromonas sp.]
MEKVWRCTVCGYLHTGDQPPENCPICGVDALKFELEKHPEQAAGADTPARSTGFVAEMWKTFVLHAVAAHFPNGMLPAAAIFLGLFFYYGAQGFEATAFHLVAFCTLVTPVVLLSGLRDWQAHFGGAAGGVFRRKIILAVLLLVFGIAAVSLRYSAGSWQGLQGWGQLIYLLLIAGMLGCVTLLGHYGGQLVFMHKTETIRT